MSEKRPPNANGAQGPVPLSGSGAATGPTEEQPFAGPGTRSSRWPAGNPSPGRLRQRRATPGL